MDGRKNCINTIRILAAAQVFLGHAVAHLNVNISYYIINSIAVIQGGPVFS